MPTIRPVKINHGEISSKEQSDILVIGSGYEVSFRDSAAITAQSSQGNYGLLHTTGIGKQADGSLSNWLNELQAALGNNITFHIIDPCNNQPESYQNDLERACLKLKIKATVYSFKNARPNQTVMINNDGINITGLQPCESKIYPDQTLTTQAAQLAKKNKTDLKINTLTASTLSQQSQEEFIDAINIQLQETIDTLEGAMLKSTRLLGKTKNTKAKLNKTISEISIKRQAAEELKEFQEILPRFAIYLKQPVTKEFLKFAQSITSQYYKQTETYCPLSSTKTSYISIRKKQSDAIQTFNAFFEKLNQDFIKLGATTNHRTLQPLLIYGPGGQLGPEAIQLNNDWFVITSIQNLPVEINCYGFINKINQKIYNAIYEIENRSILSTIPINTTDLLNLKTLQEQLNQLTTEPTQILTKKFVQLIRKNIKQYYEQCYQNKAGLPIHLANRFKLATDPTINHLFLMLEQNFLSVLSQPDWPASTIDPSIHTFDHNGMIIERDDCTELKPIPSLKADLYKSVNSQQLLIQTIKCSLSHAIVQLKKDMPILITQQSELKTLIALQLALDQSSIKQPERPLTLPFIQSLKKTIALYQQKMPDKASSITDCLFNELDNQLSSLLLSDDLIFNLTEDHTLTSPNQSATDETEYSQEFSPTLFQHHYRQNQDYIQRCEPRSAKHGVSRPR
ncbi:hypothetical protein [Piscirickettsia salmonis]|uniref:Uncharacterized protein n=3 Tax=Piscirickettsia salmonis TaxID=1238 RepID=A0A9Q6LIN2_PISSA|nr:hypothetical protein [Piscirickettsia salmonis]APS49076.1 hypothetical protein AVI49_15505 [Piscirickettsia salmonis]APS58832.1 hypothetical protein AVI52_16395 [Piscirickettsia salmonis]ERL60714.1 hypothetical protein K661_02965 [Piscirickettsia salmonis LF-89 = ATCC VR-1361]QGN79081.1 hypothetical protein Psal001_03342 [Piscirickettsia salmonis]QGN82665.1 hypothetical protein Psal002_03361 [Piscirickettsia salmonis]